MIGNTFKFIFAMGVIMAASATASAKDVVDIVGRSVEVPDAISKVALGESRMIYGVSLLEKNPTAKIVAWRDDLIRNDIDTYNKLVAKFPETKNIKDIGKSKSEINLEALIKLNPDVFIINLGQYPNYEANGYIEKLEKVGIPTVVIDFRQHPVENTVPSTLVLGDVFNQQAKAMKFINYYRKQVGLVRSRIGKMKESKKPYVFIENAAGLKPNGKMVTTYGPANFGKYVMMAGGRNYGSQLTSVYKVKVNPEVIFTEDFDVIIGTGAAGWNETYKKLGAQAVELGYNADKDTVQKQLSSLADRKGWRSLKAVKDKRMYSIYHQFYNSPYHFIAVQQFAKWIHPELFEDLDVEKTYNEFHKEFLPIDYSGQFWAELK